MNDNMMAYIREELFNNNLFIIDLLYMNGVTGIDEQFLSFLEQMQITRVAEFLD